MKQEQKLINFFFKYSIQIANKVIKRNKTYYINIIYGKVTENIRNKF